jgi:Ca2+-transporting ATPase
MTAQEKITVAGGVSASAPASPSALSGLSGRDAAHKLKQDGANELPAKRQRTLFHLMWEVMCEPMFLLLLAAGAIYLILGDAGDAMLLLGFVFITMAITIFQERKTERVLDALKDLSSPRALVIRDGVQIRIPGREVVKGDLLVLEEGDRIAADGIVIESHDLLIDESLLTGESIAVAKQASTTTTAATATATATAAATTTATPVAGATPATEPGSAAIFSGSMIVQGGGLARVTATGAETELGKIGKSLQALPHEPSPLQREISTLVKRFAIFGLALSLVVFVLYGWTRHNWFDGLLAGITLAMSMLPEEFTVILTVFMALGAWRISKQHVLTRHTPVIEALGSTTVLCVDKTGTLTQNKMSVKAVVIGERHFTVGANADAAWPESVRQLLEYTVLASEIVPFDPMEKAFHQCLTDLYPASAQGHAGWSFVHEYPLTPQLQAMTHVWQAPNDRQAIVATKGAPESIALLCKLDPAATAAMLAQVQTLASQGMRVLAVAQARHATDETDARWPKEPDGFPFVWLGLVGLADPLRPAVPQAVKECQHAGIRVVMITGDHPATAQAIAKEAGLPFDKMVTGTQLATLSDAELNTLAREVHIFARVRPEQKLRLVSAFKADGEVVAMTGDGVNDAPALKAAHIGIAMGERGTDVAREAASLVLLNDDFTSIVHAISLGRRIYDNLRKALTYVVAVHLPIAGMTLLPLLFGTPLAFAPIHIVFLEMIINPACAIVFETEAAENNIMRRAPRDVNERLFGQRNVWLAVLQGLGLFAGVAAVFFLGLRGGLSEGQARAVAFTCLVIGNLALIVTNRSATRSVLAMIRVPNRAQWWVLGGACGALAVVLTVPGLRETFHFAKVSGQDLIAPVLVGVLAVAWFELMKAAFRPRKARRVT